MVQHLTLKTKQGRTFDTRVENFEMNRGFLSFEERVKEESVLTTLRLDIIESMQFQVAAEDEDDLPF